MISHILSYTMCLRKPPPYRFYCLRLGWNLGGGGRGMWERVLCEDVLVYIKRVFTSSSFGKLIITCI